MVGVVIPFHRLTRNEHSKESVATEHYGMLDFFSLRSKILGLNFIDNKFDTKLGCVT